MPTSRSFRFAALALIVTFSVMSTGCYKNIAIRPDQIPLLSEMPSPTVVGQYGTRAVLVVPVATVLTPSGTTVEIRGEYDLLLVLGSGQEHTFEHAVRSTLASPNVLQITGSNRPATRFHLGDVRQAFVTQEDGVLSALVGALLGLAVTFGVIVTVVLLSS